MIKKKNKIDEKLKKESNKVLDKLDNNVRFNNQLATTEYLVELLFKKLKNKFYTNELTPYERYNCTLFLNQIKSIVKTMLSSWEFESENR